MQILYWLIGLVLSAAIGWFGGTQYGAKDCKADVQVKNAQAQTAQAKSQARAAERGGKRAAERATDKAKTEPLQAKVRDDLKANPPPPDCRATPQRVRDLNALIDAANAPPGVPGGPRPAESIGERISGGARELGGGLGPEVQRAAQELHLPQGLGPGGANR